MSRGGGGSSSYDGEIAAGIANNWESYVPGSVWFYQPNKIAPPIFAAAYLASGILHAWQTQHYKSRKITILIPFGALLMVAGLAMREVGAFYIDSLGYLIASIVLLYSGPPIYSGAAYFILARTLYYIPWLSPLHPGRILTMFIGIDFLIEIFVANGASKSANTSASPAEHLAGQILVKIALILQACTFVVYFVVLAIWHRRVKRANLLTKNLRNVVWTMYASAALITIRCIYRIIELFQGWAGELNTNEAYFYVFEVLLMLSNSVMLNIMHPGRLLPQDSKIYLSTDGVTELKGPGWRDPRKWYWQLMDPFDFAGCCRKEEKYDFWNHPEENAGAETETARADVETGEAKGEGVIAAAGNTRVASSEVETKKRPIWLGALYRGRK